MTRFLHRLRDSVVHFAKDCSATATVEAVIIMPLLAAWFVGSYVFFDGFKNRNTASKATYTIGDILSRRTEAATPDYLENLQELYETLVFTSGSSALRVTSLTWNGKKHRVLWAWTGKASAPALTNDDTKKSAFKNRIPLMAIGETVVLVETFTDYNAAFNVGWDNHVWENFVVTSPRFASCVAFQDGATVVTC